MIRDIRNPPGPSCIVRRSATCSEPSGDTTASRSLVQSSTRISTPANGTCVDEPVGTSCCEQQLLDMNISSQVAGQDPVGDFLFGICVYPTWPLRSYPKRRRLLRDMYQRSQFVPERAAQVLTPIVLPMGWPCICAVRPIVTLYTPLERSPWCPRIVPSFSVSSCV